jgi:hypothetical protein
VLLVSDLDVSDAVLLPVVPVAEVVLVTLFDDNVVVLLAVVLEKLVADVVVTVPLET